MKRLIVLVVACAVAAALAVPALAATKTVRIGDNFFSPKSVTVSKGTTVRWRWTGKAPHNVKVTTGPARFSSTVKTSGTYSKRMTRKGFYRIVCTIHPGMGMTLRVK